MWVDKQGVPSRGQFLYRCVYLGDEVPARDQKAGAETSVNRAIIIGHEQGLYLTREKAQCEDQKHPLWMGQVRPECQPHTNQTARKRGQWKPHLRLLQFGGSSGKWLVAG